MPIEQAIKNAVASVQIEGYQVDTECIQWCEKLLNEEIDIDQYIKIVKQKAGVN